MSVREADKLAVPAAAPHQHPLAPKGLMLRTCSVVVDGGLPAVRHNLRIGHVLPLKQPTEICLLLIGGSSAAFTHFLSTKEVLIH